MQEIGLHIQYIKIDRFCEGKYRNNDKFGVFGVFQIMTSEMQIIKDNVFLVIIVFLL
jgi:hypothetical protein